MASQTHDPEAFGPAPAGAPAHNHAVQFHAAPADLVRRVAEYLGEGLRAGDAVLAVAAADHLRPIERALHREGVDAGAARAEGRLLMLDAEEALARFMVAGAPDRERFEALFGPVLDLARVASRSGAVRVFGEMVDLLWKDRKAAATLALERMWSEAIAARDFSLLCAYALDGFPGHEHDAMFDAVCRQHGAVGAAADRDGSAAEARLRRFAALEQRTRSLEGEIERRRRLEAERDRLLAAERRARAEIALLYRVTDAANRAETLDQVYATALDGIADALGVARAAVLLVDPDGRPRFKAWRGLSDAYRATIEASGPWTPDGPAPLLCDDVRGDGRLFRYRAALDREGIAALAVFPLASGGRLLGTFGVYHAAPHAFTEGERSLAARIADQVAFAVDRKLAALERERMLGIVGHDLRNPLNAISVAAKLLLREDVSEPVTRQVRRIVASADRMERLISQLLAFAQARQGSGIALRRREADLAEVARLVVDELAVAHPRKTLRLAAEGDCRGAWDPDRLGEVLSNLVGNAIQHGADGPVEVRLRGEDGEVVAEVHNDGAPIPEAFVPSLFDPFRRGREGDGGRGSSVGLGLFISREIVRAHGGRIEARSSAGEGTTFAFRLPRG